MNFGNPTSEAESFQIMARALDGGINFIDTANSYNAGESERIVGQFLKDSGKRAEVVLATKVFSRTGSLPNQGGGTRYHILQECENSLRRLQTDHIDLYQLHRPPLIHPQDETLRAFDDLIRAGKVRYIGCSTHPAWMVMEALALSERHGLNRYVSEQPPYNLLDRRIENELIPVCQKYGLAVLPWSPLAMGLLAGRYPGAGQFPADSRAGRWQNKMVQDRVTARAVEVGQTMLTLAQERGLTASQLALLWVKDQPGITAPIIGPRTLAQLEDALAIVDKKLDDADRPLFDALVHPGTAVADFHNSNEWMKARVVA
jgi:aryl-alcohol dehydrogenase-like predicted oxidoreductase